jgi:exonuclease-1
MTGTESSPSRPTTFVSSSSPAVPKSEPTTRPPKKARLCEEAEEDDGSPKKSKFFFPSQSSKRSAARSKSEAYLLSDDSIDAALNDLPDIDGWLSTSKPRKTIRIFEEKKLDETQAASQESSVQVASQETEQDVSQGTSQDTSQDTSQGTSQDTVLSAATSFNDLPSPSDPVVPKVLMPPPKLGGRPTKLPLSDTPVRPNLRQFSYSSHSVATPASTASSRSSVFSAASTPSTAPSTARSRLTPLQRLGAKALNPAMSPKPLLHQRKPISKAPTLAGVPINPSFVPLPRVDLKEVEALNRNCGSEDQIIPDSDEEADDMEDQPLKLDLSRFVCS